MAKEKGIQGMGKDSVSSYIPSAINWDKLFNVKTLDNNWVLTIESLAYNICSYFN